MDDILKNNNNQDENVGIDPTEHVSTTTNLVQEDVNPEDLDNRWLRWKCKKCGYLYEGSTELKRCPRCGNEDPDLFDDAD